MICSTSSNETKAIIERQATINQFARDRVMKPISEAIEQYLNHCQFGKNLNKLTLKAYGQDLRQFSRLLGGMNAIDTIDKEIIRLYLRQLFELHLRETSIKRKLASLRAFLRYLEFEDEIPVSPFRKLQLQIKIPKRIPRYLSLNDVQSLMSIARKDLEESDRSSISTREKTTEQDQLRRIFDSLQKLVIIELLFSTGIRVSELCNLNIHDVDLWKKVITVSGKGSRERSVIVTNIDLQNILKRYLDTRLRIAKQPGALLINRLNARIQPHSIRSILKAFSSRAKLQTTTPHMFRHTIATLLIENGVDTRFVQKFLGHSSILTTQIYTHLSSTAEREIIGSKHPRNFL